MESMLELSQNKFSVICIAHTNPPPPPPPKGAQLFTVQQMLYHVVAYVFHCHVHDWINFYGCARIQAWLLVVIPSPV